ncbi:DUF72 domain-containing protein [Rhizobium sp. C1]|uniref:DUF72 domain-containing protein n=1 Tax=Rhizobium sp. C1 TaxID=1349799 RepID=UPI001E62C175|nr:DUF72 domain-containing protein [Rhizobium sp. C1]MCD2177058.1 DUF72 domain-containing protein [Rhizobium sp. C1]
MAETGTIRTGIGGWTFDPWKNHFYPEKLKAKDELSYASSKLRAIEVNGTYYSSQKPATFAKWAAEAPEDFVFSLKASRFCTNRRVLAEGGESVMKFVSSGITELGPKLGPILWQFMPTKQFDSDDFGAFLSLLPKEQDGIRLKHVVEVRHPSFVVPEFVDLLRKHKTACVVADHAEYPMIADITGDFVYLRLQKGEDENPHCYPDDAFASWADRLKSYASGRLPGDLPELAPDGAPSPAPRDVFAYFITGGKVNAPFGAMEMQKRVG